MAPRRKAFNIPGGGINWTAYFEELNPPPNKIALKELHRQVTARRKINPEHFENHGMVETAQLYRSAISLFEQAYKKALAEQNLWK